MELECRTCLKISSQPLDILSDDLLPKVQAICALDIKLDDNFPSTICKECARNVHLLYEFCNTVRRCNLVLEERLIKKEIVEVEVVLEDEEEEESLLEVEDKNDVFNSLCLDESIRDVVEISKELSDVEPRKRKSYFCKLCNFSSTSYNLLRSHRNSHKEATKSTCSICGKLVRSTNLRKHLSVHTEPPVQCKVCGKFVKNLECLRAHMFIHDGGPLQCITCGKIYKHRQGFYAHRKRHKLGDAKTVKCEMCGKLFYDKQTLVKHIRSHTGERPYICSYCNKGFSSLYARKTHIRRHTKEKPFTCDFCDAAFPQRVSLRTHLKSKHSDKIPEQGDSQPGL